MLKPSRSQEISNLVGDVALRDAVEDYDYLARLEQLGKAAEADAIVKPLTASFFQWDKDPAAYETARARLAALLLSALSRGQPTPPR